jgi:ribosomal protein S8
MSLALQAKVVSVRREKSCSKVNAFRLKNVSHATLKTTILEMNGILANARNVNATMTPQSRVQRKIVQSLKQYAVLVSFRLKQAHQTIAARNSLVYRNLQNYKKSNVQLQLFPNVAKTKLIRCLMVLMDVLNIFVVSFVAQLLL